MSKYEKEKLLRLLRRKKELSGLQYEPSAKQLLAHKSKKQFVVIMGGNRSGKTQTLAYEAVWTALGEHPHKDLPHKPPVRIWLMVSTQEVGNDVMWGEKLKHIIPESCIAHLRRSGPYVSQIELTNGSIISLKSYEKGETALQSASIHMLGCDEQVPWEIYQELKQRIADVKGRVMFAFTPLIPCKELKDYIEYQPKDGELCDQADMDVIKISRYENPAFAGREDEIKQAEQSMPNNQVASRIYGDWLTYTGRLVPHFGDSCIVKDFTIPKEWRRALVVDPATTGDSGCVWVAEDPRSGTWYQYQELLIAGLAPSALAVQISAMSQGTFCAKAYDTASAWFAAEAQNIPFFKNGLLSVKKSGQNEYMVGTLDERFFRGKYRVFASCHRTIKQLIGYVNKPGTPEFSPLKTDDHLVDCWKYFTQVQPPFIEEAKPLAYKEILWQAVKAPHGGRNDHDPSVGFV